MLPEVEVLSDDEIREKLVDFGCNPPPILDDVVRKILRRKLSRLMDPSLVPEESKWSSDSEQESASPVKSRHTTNTGVGHYQHDEDTTNLSYQTFPSKSTGRGISSVERSSAWLIISIIVLTAFVSYFIYNLL